MTPTEIRQLRDQCGLTQTQFASLIGTKQKSVSRWEKGDVAMGERWSRTLTELQENINTPEVQAQINKAYFSAYLD